MGSFYGRPERPITASRKRLGYLSFDIPTPMPHQFPLAHNYVTTVRISSLTRDAYADIPCDKDIMSSHNSV